MTSIVSLENLVATIAPGATLAVPADYCGVAMAATAALVRRGSGKLHLICVPASGMQTDIFVGEGLVATLETSAVTLGEAGGAPRFQAAARDGSIRLVDATCPAIHAALLAAQKGVPFMPIRGIIGSDVLAHRADWKVIDNPFESDDPIVIVPALSPDIALFHAPEADRFGNGLCGKDDARHRRADQRNFAHGRRARCRGRAAGALCVASRNRRARRVAARPLGRIPRR